ncbi:serine/threonine protein kinase [Paenibacillus sp. PK1-4R]|uniref:serine/threonine protein kinase n=1 Tax=Paenibacillus sp. PK1-4R TaxID=3049075 RepID=UPI0025A0B506|nr:serine/threonine protein kinase [Paenibacillus sp. PK1-4R]WJM09422.1 serine/threonine protein kinase [Paenibacillus sp. PK1-4R]
MNRPDWFQAEEALQQIQVIGSDRNELVNIIGDVEGLKCIGTGTDAAVFTYDGLPQYAFKMYSDHALDKLENEKQVYEQLKGLPYFPTYYGSGRNVLVISFEPGDTLLECLEKGIPVPEQVMLDVDAAREAVRSRGLNPRDIHLKNVILQNGRGKVIDVSEYIQDGNDNRWEHLVWAYHNIYPRIKGTPISPRMLQTIKWGYNQFDHANIKMDDLAKKANRLFFRFMK